MTLRVAALLPIVFAIAIALPVSGGRAQNGQGRAELAEQTYKNIQVLKGTPSSQFIPAMQFITSSLGVRCEYCHVEGAFDKDDKKPKQTARQMIQMMAELNRSSFGGQEGVTCFTCHRGSAHPVRIPKIPAEIDSNSGSQLLPTAQEVTGILEKFKQAMGGNNLRQLVSEVATGKMKAGNGVEFPIEIYIVSPDKRRVATHLSTGESVEIVNGQAGWTETPGRPLREMNADELAAARMDANLAFPDDIRHLYSDLKPLPDREIDGVPVCVVQLSNPNSAGAEFFFDKKSGTLMRAVRYVRSPLGKNPTQIDYSDYRDISGVKLPFRWTVSRPQGSFTVQLEQAQVNVPVDASKFTRPESSSLHGNH